MPKSRYWDRETIENVRDALANASDPPSTKLSTRQAVDELADIIRAKRAAGWSRRDIVDFLKEYGVDIPETTLRTYASARRASARADDNERRQRIEAGIERRPGASDTGSKSQQPTNRPAARQASDRVSYIEQDDV